MGIASESRSEHGGTVVPFNHCGLGRAHAGSVVERLYLVEMNMSKNAMAGAVTLCGIGLCVIGAALMMQSGNSAHGASTMPSVVAASIVSTAIAQAEPTVVWMGVTQTSGEHFNGVPGSITYHRLWSDGRLESRCVVIPAIPSCAPLPVCNGNWIELPPPTGGNGFACRTDINGDRIVDGADLAFVLNAWDEEGGCEPEATYPCLDLTILVGGAAVK